MRLSIDTLAILEDVTRDAAGAAHVDLEIRGKKSSIVRIYYHNGGERIRLEWDDDFKLTATCNDKVVRAIRQDARLVAFLNDVLQDEIQHEEERAGDTPDLAAAGRSVPPPTMFI